MRAAFFIMGLIIMLGGMAAVYNPTPTPIGGGTSARGYRANPPSWTTPKQTKELGYAAVALGGALALSACVSGIVQAGKPKPKP